MINKNVQLLFEELSRFYGVEIDFRWKKAIFEKIGTKIGAKKAVQIRTWISRGSLPDHAINKIMDLDIPDDIKALCLKCKKGKKTGFSLKNHKETGEALQAIYNFLNDLKVETSKAYHPKFSDKIQPIIDALIKLRSDFDNKLYQEYRDAPNKDKIYYTGESDSSITTHCERKEETEHPKSIIDITHRDVIAEFKDKKTALDINKNLAEIEKINPEVFKQTKTYIEGLATGLKATVIKKNQHGTMH